MDWVLIGAMLDNKKPASAGFFIKLYFYFFVGD